MGQGHLVVQLADSRRISLGRVGSMLFSTQEEIDENWLPGVVTSTSHTFELSPDLESPLAAQIEVNLQNEAEVVLPATDLNGDPLEATIARFTIAPPLWPALVEAIPLDAKWQNGIALRGYKLFPEPGRPGETLEVSLYWEAGQAVTGNYVVFVHLLDEKGQIKIQDDSLPRAGAYPVPWWQPGSIVEDVHPLALPDDLPGGVYQLEVGLYQSEDGLRLKLADTNQGDNFPLGMIQIE
jgi:hypothetical protein